MPGIVPRPRVGHLWLDTDDGQVRADHIETVTGYWNSPRMWLEVRIIKLLGLGRISVPKFLLHRRHNPRLAWKIVVKARRRRYVAAVCHSDVDEHTTQHTLLVALAEHRNAAGILVYNGAGGWGLTRLDAAQQPEPPEQNGDSR